jgi:hypothetical protein
MVVRRLAMAQTRVRFSLPAPFDFVLPVTADYRPRHMWRNYACLFALGMMCLFGMEKMWQAFAMCHTDFDLLNPDSVCSNEEEPSEWDYEPLRENLIQTIENYTVSGKVGHIALSFRDLKHGASSRTAG